MNAKDLRDIAAELRIITDREIDDAEIRKGLRKTATDKGIDWSQLKALVKAQAQDARDDGNRVGKLVERADFALAYAEMLNMNANNESRSSSGTQSLAGGEAVTQRTVNAPSAGSNPARSANLDMPDLPEHLDRRRKPAEASA